MRYKLTFVAGLALGYVLGTRAGRERYEQLRKSARQVAQNPAVRNTAETAAQQGRAIAGKAFAHGEREGRRPGARLGRRPGPLAARRNAGGAGRGRLGHQQHLTAAPVAPGESGVAPDLVHPPGAAHPHPYGRISAMGIVAGLDSSPAFHHASSSATRTRAPCCGRGYAPHPLDGAEGGGRPADVDPQAWLLSLGEAAGGGLLEGVQAIGVSAQQHGARPAGRAGRHRAARRWSAATSGPRSRPPT